MVNKIIYCGDIRVCCCHVTYTKVLSVFGVLTLGRTRVT